eukprot:5207978-Heterocapsa_arctica.AAC.1
MLHGGRRAPPAVRAEPRLRGRSHIRMVAGVAVGLAIATAIVIAIAKAIVMCMLKYVHFSSKEWMFHLLRAAAPRVGTNAQEYPKPSLSTLPE